MGVEGTLDDLAAAEEGTRRLEAWLAALGAPGGYAKNSAMAPATRSSTASSI
jgi:TRAP-type C4-dicarboxylate transport system permease small subunit